MDFQPILAALDDAGVQFVIIGGAAVSVHGSAYITQDLDICYARSPANVEKLVRALKPHYPRLRGAPAALPFQFDSETVLRGMNFTLASDIGDVDLFGEVIGIGSYAEVRARSLEVELYGRRLAVLSIEGLIQSKQAAGRRKDLLVIPELEALRELQPDSQADTADLQPGKAAASGSDDAASKPSGDKN